MAPTDAKPKTVCVGPAVRVEASDAGIVRVFDPPRPVLVDMRAVDPTAGQPAYASNPHHPSLRVRAAGIRFEPEVHGRQWAWIALADGQWRALVSVSLESANRQTRFETMLYLPADAIRIPS